MNSFLRFLCPSQAAQHPAWRPTELYSYYLTYLPKQTNAHIGKPGTLFPDPSAWPWGSQRGAPLGRTFWTTSISFHIDKGGSHHTGWEKARGLPGGGDETQAAFGE